MSGKNLSVKTDRIQVCKCEDGAGIGIIAAAILALLMVGGELPAEEDAHCELGGRDVSGLFDVSK